MQAVPRQLILLQLLAICWSFACPESAECQVWRARAPLAAMLPPSACMSSMRDRALQCGPHSHAHALLYLLRAALSSSAHPDSPFGSMHAQNGGHHAGLQHQGSGSLPSSLLGDQTPSGSQHLQVPTASSQQPGELRGQGSGGSATPQAPSRATSNAGQLTAGGPNLGAVSPSLNKPPLPLVTQGSGMPSQRTMSASSLHAATTPSKAGSSKPVLVKPGHKVCAALQPAGALSAPSCRQCQRQPIADWTALRLGALSDQL